MKLSNSQLLIWLGQQLKPNQPLYNSPFTFEFSTSINVPYFQFAFQVLINKSDTLRTVFKEVNGIPKQEILPSLYYTTKYIDWSIDTPSEAVINSWLEKKSQHVFNLSERCFESILIKLSEEKYIWFINQHHLITDGWSITILLNKMLEFYERTLNENLDSVPPLNQFATYLQYENDLKLNNHWKKSQAYWKQKEATLPTPPIFYGNKDYEKGTKSKRVRFDLGLELSNKIRAVAKLPKIRHFTPDLTLFNIFTTLLFAHTYKITGQNKLSISVPSHNRVTHEFKDTIGLFIELFPLNVSIEQTDAFIDLLKKVRIESNLFLLNAKSGASTVEISKNINVILNYINVGIESNRIPVKANWLHPNHLDTGHALRLEVHDFNKTGSFQLDFDFNSTIIPENIQPNTIQHFLKLLNDFIDNPNQTIETVDILSEQEKNELLDLGNHNETIKLSETNILKRFEEQVKKQPSTKAVVFEDETLTYQELDEQANQIANYLLNQNIQKGEIVGILLERSTNLIISILGVLKAGAVYMPIDSSYPETRIKYMLKDADVKHLITQQTLAESCTSFDVNIITEEPKQFDTSAIQTKIDANQLAYIIYTSGSTGNPKGSLVTHRGVVSLVNGLHKAIYSNYPKTNLNVALVAPCVFDPSVQQIFGALLQGHTLHIVPECFRLDGKGLQQFFTDNKIHISDGTPAHLRLLLNAPKNRLLPNHLIIGGEALSASLVKRVQQHFKNTNTIITNIYGVAECAVDSISYDVNLNFPILHKENIPIGKPLQSERVYILNENNQLQPKGVIGELCLSGLGVGKGYLNLDKLTQQKFIQNPFLPQERLYKTGDLARILPSGNIEFIGRKDKQVKVRGYRIELGEIENQLRSFEVEHFDTIKINTSKEINRCKKCLLSENHPNTHFDKNGICDTCNEFDTYQEQSMEYFKTTNDFKVLMNDAKRQKQSEYDCMLLYSGGKDSSYVLYRLVEMGLKVLAFTFDNGFISKAAFDNIRRQTSKLGVDSIIRKTERMDEIFIESLTSDSTVCSGCFKSLTAISTEIAEEQGINVIVTGLSRGQIYDTKLAGLYQEGVFDVNQIENRLVQFRRMFHASNDRTNRLLDIDLTHVDFEKIHFIDFFRYDQTSIADIRSYLKIQDSFWRQPKDTGFCSSNCLMNDIGICVHSKVEGYHNYEAPLSWDIRLGISTREEVLPEVEGNVNLKQVNSVLKKIGFFKKEIKEVVVVDRKNEDGDTYLIGYFIANHRLSITDIRNYLNQRIPSYMIPDQFVQLEKLPLTTNGKIDYKSLPIPDASRPMIDIEFVAPQTEFEELVAEIWQEVLNISEIGIYDNFLEIGGNSLIAIRIMARINEAFELNIPLNRIFEMPTIANLAAHIEEVITKLLAEMEE